jgi:hypothetical protein
VVDGLRRGPELGQCSRRWRPGQTGIEAGQHRCDHHGGERASWQFFVAAKLAEEVLGSTATLGARGWQHPAWAWRSLLEHSEGNVRDGDVLRGRGGEGLLLFDAKAEDKGAASGWRTWAMSASRNRDATVGNCGGAAPLGLVGTSVGAHCRFGRRPRTVSITELYCSGGLGPISTFKMIFQFLQILSNVPT